MSYINGHRCNKMDGCVCMWGATDRLNLDDMWIESFNIFHLSSTPSFNIFLPLKLEPFWKLSMPEVHSVYSPHISINSSIIQISSRFGLINQKYLIQFILIQDDQIYINLRRLSVVPLSF